MSTFTLLSLVAWCVSVASAGFFRSRLYATFLGVILGIYTLIAVAVLPRATFLGPVVYYFHGAAYFTWWLLIRPRLRPLWHRFLISYPGLYLSAVVLLSFPWAIAFAFGFELPGLWVPYVLGAFGFSQSFLTRDEVVSLKVGNVEARKELSRVSPEKTQDPDGLKIAQLTDPHLGPFMSVRQLRKICESVVNADPDLVLLTGDFLTMESQSDGRYLSDALEPLRPLAGRTFACLGNHDHEALPLVVAALEKAGIELLVDRAVSIETRKGPVDIVGFDFHFRERRRKIPAVCAENPRKDARLRLGLLHHPGSFSLVPSGELDLVFSGHTHGGQIGLLSFGFPGTVVSWLGKIPDHGLWGRGTDRLYVHRGTGHYGYPIRLGVPAERSLLFVTKV